MTARYLRPERPPRPSVPRGGYRILPPDPADEDASSPRIREARAAETPTGGAGTPDGPFAPASGPSGNTSPPAAPTPTPRGRLPEGTPSPRPATAPDTQRAPGGSQTPAGDAQRAVSAPLAGQAWRKAAKTAQSEVNAAKLRRRTIPAAKKTGPGMIRRPPPQTSGDDAA